jgi:hypothetical protein
MNKKTKVAQRKHKRNIERMKRRRRELLKKKGK